MISAVIFDLDGTVYRGADAVPGAADFIARLREEGVQPLFVTNRASRPPEEVSAQLNELGVPCGPEDILTSAQATARYLQDGSAYSIGGDGLRLALEEQGLVTTDTDPDYVIVSFDPQATYQKLATATRLILNGAEFIATNPDKCFITESGIAPGTGALVAAVATATGHDPVVIGKPERLIMDLAANQLGLPAEQIVAIGDNIETDVPAAHSAGMRSGLILTGVSSRKDVSTAPTPPTWLADTFDALWSRISPEIHT